MDTQDVVVVGRITAVFGIKGWVKVASFTDPADNLLAYRPWLLATGDDWQVVEVAETGRRNKGFVARVEDCRDRDAAAAFVARDIAVPRATLPEAGENEYYWSDLTGCEAVTTTGVALGRITGLMATGANDVMIVRDAERERLIPFTADAVVEVDLESRIVRVDWDPEF